MYLDIILNSFYLRSRYLALHQAIWVGCFYARRWSLLRGGGFFEVRDVGVVALLSEHNGRLVVERVELDFLVFLGEKRLPAAFFDRKRRDRR